MNRPLSLFCIASLTFVIALSSRAEAQNSSKPDDQVKTNGSATTLEIAKQISAATGRPIFAIAGQST